jgi:cytochrome c2
MSHHYKEKSNPIVLFLMLAFIGYLVYWVFTSQYSKGAYIAKAHPHEEIGSSSAKEEKKPNKYKLEKMTGESKAYGKELYDTTCKSCHGETGLGDGAAGQGIVPAPRNFTKLAEFKFGYTSEDLYKTLEKGSPGTSMAAFGYLPEDDRIAITHYVRSLMPVSNDDVSTDATTSATKDTKSNSVSSTPSESSTGEDYLDVVLNEKHVKAVFIEQATAPTSASKMSMDKIEKLKALFSDQSQQKRVAINARLFVDHSKLKLDDKLASFTSFKTFVLSENVYNLIGESFATTTDAELQAIYQQINGK